MAEQKNAPPPQRGGSKKSDKKKTGSSGATASRRKSRKSHMYHNAGHKARNVKRNLAKQSKAEANQPPGRTERGQARAMRRASVTMATGATSNLAAVERQLSPEERRKEDTQEKLFRALFGASPEQAT